MNQQRPHRPGQQGRSDSRQGHGPKIEVLFDPSKPEAQLFDQLAEAQVEQFREESITSHQLRRFFGEVKELYRIFENRCASNDSEETRKHEFDKYIAARFKMIRSKVFYAEGQQGNKLPPEFGFFLKESIRRVQTHSDFVKFVKHFEAIVGFIYGMNRLAKR